MYFICLGPGDACPVGAGQLVTWALQVARAGCLYPSHVIEELASIFRATGRESSEKSRFFRARALLSPRLGLVSLALGAVIVMAGCTRYTGGFAPLGIENGWVCAR